jgi:hypothetical protein
LIAFGKEKIKKSSTSISNMEKPSGGRGKANPNRWTHLKPLNEPHEAIKIKELRDWRIENF